MDFCGSHIYNFSFTNGNWLIFRNMDKDIAFLIVDLFLVHLKGTFYFLNNKINV